jgi:hypothetical protein
MTVHLELIGLPGCRLLFAPARYLFECGMNIHAHLSPARSIFAPLPDPRADELEPRWVLWLDADERIDVKRSGSTSGRLSAARPGSTRVSRSTCTVRCTLGYAPSDSANRRMA